jgi:hypothetical protein
MCSKWFHIQKSQSWVALPTMVGEKVKEPAKSALAIVKAVL